MCGSVANNLNPSRLSARQSLSVCVCCGVLVLGLTKLLWSVQVGQMRRSALCFVFDFRLAKIAPHLVAISSAVGVELSAMYILTSAIRLDKFTYNSLSSLASRSLFRRGIGAKAGFRVFRYGVSVCLCAAGHCCAYATKSESVAPPLGPSPYERKLTSRFEKRPPCTINRTRQLEHCRET